MPASILHIQEALERYPERTGKLLDKIYNLAIYGEGKVSLMAAIDYLDRIGMRAPKESTLFVKGMIAVGTPEDYRRAALLLAADREAEVKLLGHNSNSANNQIQDEANGEAVEGEGTDYEDDTVQTDIVQSALLGRGLVQTSIGEYTPLSESPTLAGDILEEDGDPGQGRGSGMAQGKSKDKVT